ncbi:MAG: nucleotidyltransferase domain-containing protein [Candidatus Dormibacteraeota bacterium]|nr:nucleotidyltransferase domain-containing protein [Candidatus Dormibacteraeota bacterium]
MTALETLARQAAHRDAWLRDIAQSLANDERFTAAWLVGSFGTGSADELSDIDLVVVIDDRQADAVLEHAVQEIARFGETVWLQEVPGNAPSGGAYVSAGFKSTPLPIAVDWYWHRLRLAVYPSDAHLVFDKEGVRPSDPPASFAELMSRRVPPGADRVRPAPSDADRIGFFWAMVPVAAKYGARGWDEKAGRILRGLEEQLDTMRTSRATRRGHIGATPPLRQLRLLIDEMDHLVPTLRARGISTPDTSYAHAFMNLAEGLKREGWRSP